jgi:predicted nuclease of predicted toxin-antitoxin system
VRLLADSNVVAQAVRAMRAAGHDVVYVGERRADPGDETLIAEAAADGRIFLTKDHDMISAHSFIAISTRTLVCCF